MAKISTYPNVGTPTLSDMLIGTEVTDNNATKNFQISDILGLIGSLGLYVPYTGATANVDLGSFSFSSTNIIYTGSLYAAIGSVSVFADTVVLEGELRDGFNQPGTAGQILSSTGSLTQWISLSSLSLNLQQVLDDGNTADQNIILTGASNQIQQQGDTAGILQIGNDAFISQIGPDAYITQVGADARISQQGTNAYISQAGDNASIRQTGTDSYISQTGVDAFIRQSGHNTSIQQTGDNSFIDQAGPNAYISQAGINSIIEQTGTNAYISQAGDNASIQQTGTDSYISQTGIDAFIEQTGTNAAIKQTGATAYISQSGTTGYMQPAQIKDSAGLFGSVGDVLVSLGTNLGVEWQDKNQVGSFFDITSQPNVTSFTARPMIFGSNAISAFGVAITNDTAVQKTQIVVSERGYYNVQFSAQVRNGTTDTTVDVWFRRNGTDIANSNKSVTITGNHLETLSWNYFVLLDTTDVLQIMWSHDNPTHAPQLAYQAATAPHPATPSTILTVNRVR